MRHTNYHSRKTKPKRLILTLLSVVVLLFTTMIPVFAAGETGTITIQGNDSVSLAGKNFYAYRILDATLSTGTPVTPAYTVPDALKSFYGNYFAITEGLETAAFNRAVSAAILNLNAHGMETFAKQALSAAKAAAITPLQATGVENQAVFLSAPLGYYVIEDKTAANPSSVVSALMIDTTKPDATISIKATLPTIDKKILDPDEVSANEASIGEDVIFKLASAVPDMTGYNHYYFVVNDTLAKGFTFKEMMSVKIGTNTLIEGTDYSVERTTDANGETFIRIIFKNFLQYKSLKGTAVVIQYKTVLNDNALIGTPNINKATIIYSNDPSFDYSSCLDNDFPDDPAGAACSKVGVSAESQTKTYSTSLDIRKRDDKDNALTGAAFRITGDGIDAELQTNEHGRLVFNGLGAGTYTITETVTPPGFNSIDPITLVIELDDTNVFRAWADDEPITSSENKLYMTITNTAGKLLPSTGGVGTTAFYVLGSVLIAGTVLFFISKKRATEKSS